MTSKAYEMAIEFRNKAIAVLRLKKVNGLTQELQEANSNLKSAQSNLETANKKIAEVNSNEFAPSFQDLSRYATADEARAAVLKDLTEASASATKSIETATKSVAEIEAKIVSATKGEKPYKFSRDSVTEMADTLIEQNGSTFTLADIEVVDEGTQAV